MNPAAPFQQLVERRLWPIALVLAGGAVAAPVLLGGSDAPVSAPAAAPANLQAQAQSLQPVVSMAAAGARDEDRKVLGSRKDPFAPVPVKARKAERVVVDADRVQGSGAAAPSSGGSAPGGSGGGGTATPGVSAPAAPVTPKKVYELLSLRVRFGETSSETLPGQTLKRLTPLPDADAPVAIYLGMLKDNKTAVFLVDASSKVQGDGKCEPSLANCQTLHLKVGETAFFDVVDEAGTMVKQYQLDIVKLLKKRTTNAKAAKRSRASVADGGRDALRARSSRLGRLRYDPRTGKLKKLTVKAWKAQASRAAAR